MPGSWGTDALAAALILVSRLWECANLCWNHGLGLWASCNDLGKEECISGKALGLLGAVVAWAQRAGRSGSTAKVPTLDPGGSCRTGACS